MVKQYLNICLFYVDKKKESLVINEFNCSLICPDENSSNSQESGLGSSILIFLIAATKV